MENLQSHHIQILSSFIFKVEADREEINFENIPSLDADSHLQFLVENGYMLVNNDGRYSLTSRGKDISGRLDFQTAKIEKQPKTVMSAACRKMINGKEHYLMHIRREHPYYGFLGFPSGTAKHGQLMEEGVIRELEEETGLTGFPLLKEIKHMLISTRDTGEIMDDVMMYAFEIINLEGELIDSTIEGENIWMSLDEIKQYDKVAQNVWGIIDSLHKHGVVFVEEKQEYDSL